MIKVQLKGTIACLLLPGLENIPVGGIVSILCKVSSSHDPEIGHCEPIALCEVFGGPIEALADFNGKTFEHVWWLLHLEGTLNKDIYIDD